MTSDAKIGLLLGLVFIFIIAFVINGLPRFKSVLAENELTLNANPSEERATPAQRARQAQSVDYHSEWAL